MLVETVAIAESAEQDSPIIDESEIRGSMLIDPLSDVPMDKWTRISPDIDEVQEHGVGTLRASGFMAKDVVLFGKKVDEIKLLRGGIQIYVATEDEIIIPNEPEYIIRVSTKVDKSETGESKTGESKTGQVDYSVDSYDERYVDAGELFDRIKTSVADREDTDTEVTKAASGQLVKDLVARREEELEPQP